MTILYKAALIGCGKIASQFAIDPKIKGIYTHAGAYKACSKTELIAVCDINETSALECANYWNVPHYYTDLVTMLALERADVVSICTPDETHADILEIVIDTPGIKGILIEKPLALDVKRSAQIIQQANKKNIKIVVNYNRRYAEGHQKIKTYIEEGHLGIIKKISGYYTKGIVHNGTHWLDLARWLIGEIKTVQGFHVNKEKRSDPSLDAWLKFKNETIGYLHGLDANDYSLFEMDILGQNGRVRISHSGYDIEYFTVKDSEHFSGYKTLQKNYHENDIVSDTLLQVVSDLIDSIKHGTEPRCSGQDGLIALTLAHAIIESHQSGREINLDAG